MIWTMRRTPATVMGRRRVDFSCRLEARFAANLGMVGGFSEVDASAACRVALGWLVENRPEPGAVAAGRARSGAVVARRSGEVAARRSGTGFAAADGTVAGGAGAFRARVVGARSIDG